MRERISHAAAMLGIPMEDVQVVLITTRRAFADSKNDELINKGGHDFLHCLVGREEMTDLRTAKKLTIEIESSHLLQGGKPPHLLFWDEGETFAALWSNDTMKTHLVGNMTVMQWLIASTQWILWMDDTPTRRGMVWMQELMMQVDRRAMCTLNDKILLQRRAYRVKSVLNWLTLLVDKVTAKKRMAIVLGTKKLGDRVWTLLTQTYAELQLKVLYYHDGMSADVKATLKDVNKYWPKYDQVMYTSSILNGIDCYVENHFHCGMIFGSAGHGPNARDLFQMAHRVCRFVDEEMYFCMQQSNYGTARCQEQLACSTSAASPSQKRSLQVCGTSIMAGTSELPQHLGDQPECTVLGSLFHILV